MSTIDWPEGESQTFVLIEDNKVRVDGDHADTGQRSALYDVPTARARAAAHRLLADALDHAADHILATRLTESFARLERLIESHDRLGDAEEIAHATATVRALLDGTEPPALPTPALEEAPVIT